MKNQNTIIACAITALVAGIIGFYANNLYQQSQRNSRFGQMGNRTGTGQNRGNANSTTQPGMMRGGALIGEVISKDDKSLTIKLPDGSSKIVILSSSTNYRISSESKLDDIAIGKTISILGTSNADGSTTASSVELNPITRSR